MQLVKCFHLKAVGNFTEVIRKVAYFYLFAATGLAGTDNLIIGIVGNCCDTLLGFVYDTGEVMGIMRIIVNIASDSSCRVSYRNKVTDGIMVIGEGAYRGLCLVKQVVAVDKIYLSAKGVGN